MRSWARKWAAAPNDTAVAEATSRKPEVQTRRSRRPAAFLDPDCFEDEYLNDRLREIAHKLRWLVRRDLRLDWIKAYRKEVGRESCLRMVDELERLVIAFEPVNAREDHVHASVSSQAVKYSEPDSYFQRVARICGLRERD